MRHDYQAAYKNVRLRPLERADIESLRQWRNDPRNTTFLSTLPYITENMQVQWFERYLTDQDCMVFAIDETEHYHTIAGSVALYHFDGDCCEYGRFMVGDSRVKGQRVGLNGLLLCLHIAFQKLGIQTIVASVHEDNLSARKTDDRAGFLIEGKHDFVKGGSELEIRLDKERFYALHPQMMDVKI